MSNYNVSASQRWWIEISNYSNVPHATSASVAGGYVRSILNGYSSEALATFDVSSITSGSTITSATISGAMTWVGGLPIVSYVHQQNKTDYSTWPNPPLYTTFSNTAWDNTLTSASTSASGTITYPSTSALTALVQSWVNGSVNWRNGIVIDADFQFFNYTMTFSSLTLNVSATDPVSGGMIFTPLSMFQPTSMF